jgi:dTDP-4-amino-4,6-dideoxygalactose transaminase
LHIAAKFRSACALHSSLPSVFVEAFEARKRSDCHEFFFNKRACAYDITRIAQVPIPFIRPKPAYLPDHYEELADIRDTGVYSNYGPVNTRFERGLTEQLFGGVGGCVTVCNATIGLMLAIREAVGEVVTGERRYALMPAFTFAATAHAALWAGLTPLLCDVDEETWLPCAAAEETLLQRYAGRIAVLVPYATFGNNLDLARYDSLSRAYDVPIVVDAAASLGSQDEQGRGFGTGCRHAVVYSMHATKTFATAEGGVIYCADQERLVRLRAMGNFGFGMPRTATMSGLNAKLSEIGALLALAKLGEFEQLVERRAALAALYRQRLPTFEFQRETGRRCAHQFMPVLISEAQAPRRAAFIAALAARGIGAGHYFSPHLHEQPYFREHCVAGGLAVTDRLSRRALSLPIFDDMTRDELGIVCDAVWEQLEAGP